MTDVVFASLTDVELRKAWRDEARNFTPWLAENLGRLGEAIGLELEFIKAEAGLPTEDDAFSVDILARDLGSDANVIIENQLENSDHRHLGQILTYLAGLEARTVIWVAPAFREAHLAAIRWLNQHTTEEFSFFAVKIRVVQIANSPLAPLFDILEKPNDWERRLQAETRAAKAMSETGLARSAFWRRFQEAFPRNARDGAPGDASNMWRRCAGDVIVSYYIAKDGVGIFVRGDSGVAIEGIKARLESCGAEIERRLGVAMGDNAHIFPDSLSGDFRDPAQFDSLASWLDERVATYASTFDHILGTE